MPYCCQCGNPTRDTDVYCGSCGARQLVAAGKNWGSISGISPRAASVLCYIPIVGWIPAIVVLASRKFREDHAVRFHAFQGIYLFVAWLLVDWVIAPMSFFPPFWHGGRFFPGLFVGGLLKILIFFTWIFMLVKTSQDHMYKLPLLGELADRSVSEQK
jgi:uncharacterized membrane protein